MRTCRHSSTLLSRRLAPRTRGSVLLIVMVTLVFASFALIAFQDKALNDLWVDHRDTLNRRMRMEAYSALETTLAVLEDFRETNNGLHSPAEGWFDPLGFAGYVPSEGRTVEVTFDDESGKISLPHADAQTLSKLFQSWEVTPNDADVLADALMGWMKRDHIYKTAVMPDYDQSAIPYEPPARPLRSYAELAAIDKVREFFYEPDGRPNENWRRFVASVSLLDFAKSNINGAKAEALAAIGQYDMTQQGVIMDYTNGRGQFATKGPGYFQDPSQAQVIAGQGGNAGAFGTTISALRVNVTVHEGRSQFKLAAIVTWANGAKVVREKAQRTVTSTAGAQANRPQPTPTPTPTPSAGQNAANASGANNQNLRYPFTLLEIRENDEIPAVPSVAVDNRRD